MVVRRLLPVVLALVAAAVQPAAAAGQHQLSIVEPAEVELTAETCKDKVCSTKQATVWVRNAGPAATDVAFAADLRDGDGGEVDATVVVDPDEGTLEENTVLSFRVSLTGLAEGKSASGVLVATATGAWPGTVDLAVAEKPADLDFAANAFLWGPLLFGLIFVLVRWATWGLRLKPKDCVGSVNLDFTKSFASTLTAVGALLGTLLSSSALPDETSWLSKEEYTALNVVFGVLIVAAGVSYAAFQKINTVEDKDGKKTLEYQGPVWAFVLACGVTIWAVVGEVAVLFAIIAIELGGGSFTAAANDLLGLIVVLTIVPMLIYAWKSMKSIAEKAKSTTVEPRAQGQAYPYPMGSWSLL